MATAVMKVEAEAEACCVCGSNGGDLMTPEEYDAGADHAQTPLRAMLLHINNTKVSTSNTISIYEIYRLFESLSFIIKFTYSII